MITNFIGNTPLVKLKNPYGEKCAKVFVKLEEYNPGGSIKSRVAFKMIEDAEINKILTNGEELIEATGGNTGMGLAIASIIKGYRLTLVIPDNFSQEKINVLKHFGVNIVLSDHTKGSDSHILRCKELIENKKYVHLDQFSNISNPNAHYFGTGRELVNQLENEVDYFVSSIGSGGTIMGCAKLFKDLNLGTKIIGVQPKGCDIMNDRFVSHRIQATAVGIVAPFVEKSLIDEMLDVTIEEAIDVCKYLVKSQGIFVGISSGANIAKAFELSKKVDRNKNIVTVAPDSGRSYLDYYEE